MMMSQLVNYTDVQKKPDNFYTMALIAKNKRYYAPVSIADVTFELLIDTGSPYSFISLEVVKECGLVGSIVRNITDEHILMSNLKLTIHGTIEMSLDFGGKSVSFQYIVLDRKNTLGLDFLYGFGCALHLCSGNPTLIIGQRDY